MRKKVILLYAVWILILSTVGSASASTNYIDTGINALPSAETSNYIVFVTASSGSVRIRCYSKSSHTLDRDISINVGGSVGTCVSRAVDDKIVIFVVHRDYDDWHRVTWIHYDPASNTYLQAFRGFAGDYESVLDFGVSCNIAAVSNTTFYAYLYEYTHDSYSWDYITYKYIVKAVVSDTSISISLISLSRKYSTVHLSYLQNENRLLLIGKIYGTSTIEYAYFDIATNSFTSITNHLISDDYSIQNIVNVRAFYTDEYLQVHVLSYKSESESWKFVYHKLIFNQTLSNFLNQYRATVTVTPSVFGWMTPYFTGQTLKVYYAELVSGNPVVWRNEYSIEHYDDVDRAVSITLQTSAEATNWYAFEYRNYAASVKRILWYDEYIYELYDGTCYIWWNIPPEGTYLVVSYEINPEVSNNILLKGTTYQFTITVTEFGYGKQGVAVRFYESEDGSFVLQESKLTDSNGQASFNVYYPEDSEKDYANLKFDVVYYGDVISTRYYNFYLVGAGETPSWPSQVVIPIPSLGELGAILHYLWTANVLGFIKQTYVYSFGSLDAFIAVLMLACTIPLYIRTKSLTLLCIVWICVGGIYQTLSPTLNIYAVFFMIMGVGGLIYRLFMSD